MMPVPLPVLAVPVVGVLVVGVLVVGVLVVLPVGLQLPGVGVATIEVWGHRAVAVLPVGVAVLPVGRLPLGRASFVPVPEWPQALPYCREEPVVAHQVGVAWVECEVDQEGVERVDDWIVS
jgi:hypothetical protein